MTSHPCGPGTFFFLETLALNFQARFAAVGPTLALSSPLFCHTLVPKVNCPSNMALPPAIHQKAFIVSFWPLFFEHSTASPFPDNRPDISYAPPPMNSLPLKPTGPPTLLSQQRVSDCRDTISFPHVRCPSGGPSTNLTLFP